MYCIKCGKEILNEQELCEECLKKESVEVVTEEVKKPNKKLCKIATLLAILAIGFAVISFALWTCIVGCRFLMLISDVTIIINIIDLAKSFADLAAGGLMIAGLVIGIISAAKKRGKSGMILAIIAFVLVVALSITQGIGDLITSLIIRAIMM